MEESGKNRYEEFKGFSDPESDRSVLLDKRQVRRTQTLFVDVNQHKGYEPLYTMRDQDYKGYVSAYQIYMHSVDESDAALKLLGSIDHWNKLCELQWFKDGGVGFTGVDQWREDMRNRDLRMAKEALLHQVKQFGDASAARALANWEKTVNAAPKEPTKPKKKENVDPAQKEKESKIAELHSRIKK